MTVGELKAWLADKPDDWLLLTDDPEGRSSDGIYFGDAIAVNSPRVDDFEPPIRHSFLYRRAGHAFAGAKIKAVVIG